MKKNTLRFSLRKKTFVKVKFIGIFILFFAFSLFSSQQVWSQSIPGTGTSAGICGNCNPTGWADADPALDGTPDISNRNQAGGGTTAGAGATWLTAPLPLPPTGDVRWITLRDVGSSTSIEENVTTTMTGLTVGKTYKLVINTMTSTTNANGGTGSNQVYAGTFIEDIDVQVGSNPRRTLLIPASSQNVWGQNTIIFIATATSETFTVFPGSDSGFDGATANLPLVEMIHLSVDGVTALEILDTDGDGIDDTVDIDDDNDGILDVTESGGNDPNGDEDGDGIPNYLDVFDDNLSTDGSTTDYTDANADGLPDAYDFDRDGIPNHLDLDSDNDGILDNVEFQTTAGFTAPSGSVGTNGYYDIYETSADSGTAANAPVNTDSSFGADYLDIDSDNDGIPDNVEAQTTLGYTAPTGNVGENGVDSAYENVDTYSPTGITLRDTDVDGTLDFRDSDSDNDGINDIDENGEGNVVSGSDLDGDGLDNNFDADNVNYDVNDNINTPSTDLPDADGDVNTGGNVDFRDDVTGTDTDDDGIPDTVDLDDDNDGILDTRELCGTSPGTTANSTITVEVNFDNFSEDITWNLRNPSNTVILTESYGAGISTDTGNNVVVTTVGDYTLEVIDSFGDGFTEVDGDGISFFRVLIDGIEVYNTTSALGNNPAFGAGFTSTPFSVSVNVFSCINGDPSADDDDDGTPNYQDADYVTGVGGDSINANGTWSSLDHDGDGVPDHLDLDSDNDGITDNLEAQTTSGYIAGTGVDTDNDGVDDAYDPDCTPCGAVTGTEIVPVNTDSDAQPDYKDIDADDDGIPDNVEAQTTTGYNAPNGVPGANGLDSAYDFTDSFSSTGLNSTLVNTDGTGEPDFRDTDSDDDGTPDIEENGDPDNAVSGTDTDGDGLDDNFEGASTNDIDPNDEINDPATDLPDNDADVNTVGDVDYRDDLAGTDTDGDGIVDSVDIDDDNDGILDTEECPETRVVFSYTGADQLYTIPSDADFITLKIWGAGGRGDTQSGRGVGGAGGYTEVTLPVSSLTSNNLIFTVGQGGDSSIGAVTYGNGGAGSTNGTRNFGSGGGMSAVSYTTLAVPGSVTTADLIAIAGGGGTMPAFTTSGTQAGVGGGTTGGAATETIDPSVNGQGGTQSAGGSTGVNGNPGSFLQGGNSANNGGAGGGGYYGGGSGSYDVSSSNNEGGGGGGSGYITGAATGTTTAGTSQTPANTGDSDYVSGVGTGGNSGGVNGGNGLIVLIITSCDFDGDGIPNSLDLDSDGDGILDNIEAQTTAGYTAPTGTDTDGDGLDDAYDATPTTGATGSNGITPVITVNDGNPDYNDIDSDDDGIPDNVEAQSTAGYVAPSGTIGLNGIDAAYENNDSYSATALSPINFDGTDEPDYRDTDSDNDGTTDATESGITLNPGSLGTDSDGDGLDDIYEGSDATSGEAYDVNDEINDPVNDLLDVDGDGGSTGDVDYRDTDTSIDTDQDGIDDEVDIDDDNDGIIDTLETQCANPSAQFQTNVEAYWSLDNNTNDISGNGNNERTDGNTPGFSTTAIQGTHSANFNGTSNMIRYSQDGGFMEQTYSNISFSAWIQPASVTGTRIIYEEGGVTNGVVLWLNGNVLTATTRSGGAGSQANAVHPTTLSLDGLWHHVAMTFASGTLTVYLDGVPASTTAGHSSIPNHTNDGGIGGAVGGQSAIDTTGFYSGLMDAVRYSNTTAWSSTDIAAESLRICDSDGDGIIDSLDIDSDNDGIPDNIEAQLTSTYIAPSGSGTGITDANSNGLDDNYETAQGGTDITPVNTDSITGNNADSLPDYLDTDTDGDGILDINENGNASTLTGTDTDGDGLDDAFEGVLNDNDVNDDIDDPATDLPDLDSDVNTPDGSQPDAAEYNDVDYRDIDDDRTPPSVVGNILWLRGDIGVTGIAEVTNWADQSGSGFNAVTNGGTGPIKLGDSDDGGLNFNPTLQFTGTQGLDIVNGILGNGVVYTDLWIYSVNSSTSATTLSNIINQGVTGATEITYQVPTAGSLFSFNPATGTALTAAWGGIAGSTDNAFSLWNAGFSSASTTPSGQFKAIYRDGLRIATNNDGTNFTSDNSDLSIGADLLNLNFFSGEIAELMVFTSVPSALEQQQIQSYLAIKYGITLSQTDLNATINEGDYILEDLTTVVWDESANSTYHNGVAGIGRDDGMLLNQKQSSSKDSDAIVTIGLGSIAGNNALNTNSITSNKSFLMWGHNGTAVNSTNTSSVSLLCESELQLDRVWKIVETGTIGKVEVAVPTSILDAALTTPTSEVIVMKVADNASFTTNVKHIPVSTRTINGVASYVANFNFNGTKYFTFSEVLGIFWNGDSASWTGGAGTAGAPSTDPSIDGGKVLVIDAETSGTNAILTSSANVECLWVKANSKLVVNNDLFIEFDQDFVLNGEIRLIGDAQLVQSHTGLSNVQGNGKIYRDQQASVPSVYRYHYWSSPVVAALGNSTYTTSTVMFDGTTPTSQNSTARAINWQSWNGNISSLNGAATNPITIATWWIYAYFNGVTRDDWSQKLHTGAINVAEGFIMKSTGRAPQNFTFIGTPNDGTYTKVLTPGTTSLLGNPYPSVLNAQQFISDNSDVIDGTLYFWEHQGEVTTSNVQVEGHGRFGYIGGYSQRNEAMGVAANSVVDETAGLGEGTYTSPPQYIAVAQGFFVSAPSNKGGTLLFENSQRTANTDNFFFRNNDPTADLPKFKIGMDYVSETDASIHRQLGINFKEGHTFEYESGFDSQVFDLQPTDMYWDFDEIESNLVIAGVGALSTDLQVPLGFQIDSDFPVHVMIDEVENMDGYEIYFGDLVTGRLYNLENPLELDLPKGTYNDRFILLFGGEALSTGENPLLEGFNVFMNNTTDQIMIRNNNNSVLKKVELFNILGQPVKTWRNLDATQTQYALDVVAPAAIYVVKVTTEKGEITRKIFID